MPHILFFPSQGKVSVLLNHGMVVHLSDHIKGLVPRTHLSDIILKNPEKKYMEGMKVKCRVSAVLYFVLKWIEKPQECSVSCLADLHICLVPLCLCVNIFL